MKSAWAFVKEYAAAMADLMRDGVKLFVVLLIFVTRPSQHLLLCTGRAVFVFFALILVGRLASTLSWHIFVVDPAWNKAFCCGLFAAYAVQPPRTQS